MSNILPNKFTFSSQGTISSCLAYWGWCQQYSMRRKQPAMIPGICTTGCPEMPPTLTGSRKLVLWGEYVCREISMVPWSSIISFMKTRLSSIVTPPCEWKMGEGFSSVDCLVQCITDTGSTPQCGEELFSQSWLSLQTLLQCSQPLCASTCTNICVLVKNPEPWQPSHCFDTWIHFTF